MVSVLMTMDEIQTVGDDHNAVEQLGRGIPEGEPGSSTWFNIFIDTLLVLLTRVPSSVLYIPTNCFADDVRLMAKERVGLQYLLGIRTSWAQIYGIH